MNAATILIGLVIAGLLFLAVRYLMKHGMCAGCENGAACRAARKAGGTDGFSGCPGACSACPYHEQELEAAAKAAQVRRPAAQ